MVSLTPCLCHARLVIGAFCVLHLPEMIEADLSDALACIELLFDLFSLSSWHLSVPIMSSFSRSSSIRPLTSLGERADELHVDFSPSEAPWTAMLLSGISVHGESRWSIFRGRLLWSHAFWMIDSISVMASRQHSPCDPGEEAKGLCLVH